MSSQLDNAAASAKGQLDQAAALAKDRASKGKAQVEGAINAAKESVHQAVAPSDHAAQATSDTAATFKSALDSAGDESKNLKHLTFVKNAAVNTSNITGTVYTTVRPLTPAVVEPLVSSVEETLTAYSAPVVAKAADVGDKLLAQADAQVEAVTKRILHTTLDQNIKDAKSATIQTVGFVQTFTTTIADKAGVTARIEWGRQQFKDLLKVVDEATNPDNIVGLVGDIWDIVSKFGPVNYALATAEPVTSSAKSTFTQVHDTVVTSDVYKQVVDTGVAYTDWAVHTYPGSVVLYFSPWLRIATEKLKGSQKVQSYVNYWKPAVSI